MRREGAGTVRAGGRGRGGGGGGRGVRGGGKIVFSFIVRARVLAEGEAAASSMFIPSVTSSMAS